MATQSLVRVAYLQIDDVSKRLQFNVLIAFYSIWTLDILRSLHPDNLPQCFRTHTVCNGLCIGSLSPTSDSPLLHSY